MSNRLYLLPSLSANMFQSRSRIAYLIPVSFNKAIQIISDSAEVINYIRHPATVQLLKQKVPKIQDAKDDMFIINDKEQIYRLLLVSLNKRLPKGTVDADVKPEDLSFLLIYLEV